MPKVGVPLPWSLVLCHSTFFRHSSSGIRHSAMSLPPNRSNIETERRNPRSMRLHAMSVRELVDLIRTEDRAVFDAMDKAASAIAALIEAAEPGFLAGGRLIYLGAGTSGR